MDATAWFERGRELGCFRDDTAQMAYLLAWRRGDVSTVRAMLASVFAGPYPLHLVNSASFGPLYERLERCDDGPDMLPEDWREADFSVVAHDGTVLSASWLTGGSLACRQESLDSLLAVLARALALSPRASTKRESLAGLRDEILGVSVSRRSSLSSLARAHVGAALLGYAAPSSPALRALVPEHAALASLAPGLLQRADRLASLWRNTLGASALGEAAPVTHAALASCLGVPDVAAVLLAATSVRNHNLMTYLSAE